MTFKEYCKSLESKIEKSYTDGVTMSDAESLAAEFLHAQLKVSEELKRADLDSRMRKAGLKAIRAAVYLEVSSKSEKRPTEATIAALVDSDDIVRNEQQAFDTAEVERDDLERYYNVFIQAHVHFRQVSKGNYGG